MNYWIVTQFPPPKGRPKSAWAIYLPDGRESAGEEMQPGDLIAVYQSKHGRDVVSRTAAGGKSLLKAGIGARGVIAILKATTAIEEYQDIEKTEYANGRVLWWKWKAQTVVESTAGFVPKQEVARILGYKENYHFRGFGDKHSGLKKIGKESFEELRKSFCVGHSVEDEFSALRKLAGQKPKGPEATDQAVGEGPRHLNLKNYIAENASEALGESGMEVVRVEYPFATRDCADIILKDKFNRIIGLEVETDVREDSAGMAGVLQAIKYRFMSALVENRTYENSRSFLVAYSVVDRIKRLCRQYDIEVVVVPEETVKVWMASKRQNKK